MYYELHLPQCGDEVNDPGPRTEILTRIPVEYQRQLSFLWYADGCWGKRGVPQTAKKGNELVLAHLPVEAFVRLFDFDQVSREEPWLSAFLPELVRRNPGSSFDGIWPRLLELEQSLANLLVESTSEDDWLVTLRAIDGSKRYFRVMFDEQLGDRIFTYGSRSPVSANIGLSLAGRVISALYEEGTL